MKFVRHTLPLCLCSYTFLRLQWLPSSPTTTLTAVLLILILKSILSDNITTKLLSFDKNFSGTSFPSPLLLTFLDPQIINVFLGNGTFLNNLNSIR